MGSSLEQNYIHAYNYIHSSLDSAWDPTEDLVPSFVCACLLGPVMHIYIIIYYIHAWIILSKVTVKRLRSCMYEKASVD